MSTLFKDDSLDTSLEDFLSDLYDCIINDKIQNSFNDYEYKILNTKNALYKAIESYRDNGTIFYSKLISDHPEINIKSIGEIRMGEHNDFKGRLAIPNGSYHLKFTVYYDKN